MLHLIAAEAVAGRRSRLIISSAGSSWRRSLTITLRARFDTLTPREREVMALVVAGRLSKQIAYEIGVSEITVKVHRGQVMRKMQAASLPDLARIADRLNLAREKSQSC